MRLKTLFTILILLSATACSTVATSGCDVFGKKISTSRQDTLTKQTENEIIAHNAKVERFCMGEPWGGTFR